MADARFRDAARRFIAWRAKRQRDERAAENRQRSHQALGRYRTIVGSDALPVDDVFRMHLDGRRPLSGFRSRW